MTWKQPIPTNVVEMCRGNKFDSVVYMLLLLRARTTPETYYLPSGGYVYLERGQSFCGRFELAEYLGLTETQSGQIQRSLSRLQKPDELIDKQKTRNGSIVTIKNFDEVIRMDKQTDNQQTNHRQTIDTYKTVKSVKSDREAYKTKEFLLNIPKPDLENISKDLGVTVPNIILKGKEIYDWCESKGKVYKNYRAFLKICLRRDNKTEPDDNYAKFEDIKDKL